MNSLSEKILEEIHSKKITPRSRWYFLTKEWILWFACGVVTLLGAVAFSIVLFFLFNVNWKVRYFLEMSQWKILFQMMPLLWVVLFVGLFILSLFHAHQTKRGYRYHRIIIFSTLGISFVLGIFIYQMGMAHIVESIVGSHIPRYQTLLERKAQMWHRPEEGLLGGQIVAIENPKIFVLRDRYLVVWNIEHNFQENSFVEVGRIVRVEGEMKREGYFEAHSIVPVQIHGGKRELIEKNFCPSSIQMKEAQGNMRTKGCGFGQTQLDN